MLRKPTLLATAIALTLPALVAAPRIKAQTPIRITADLTEAPRKLYHAEIDLPVKPGPATFITPQWIPGNHRPTGPVADITGVVFSIDGKPLPWRRDDENLYEFHVDIPKGVTTLHPANTPVADIAIQPSVTVPTGWGIGTALTPSGTYDPNAKVGGTTAFQPTTVEQLEDSPVISGEYFGWSYGWALAGTLGFLVTTALVALMSQLIGAPHSTARSETPEEAGVPLKAFKIEPAQPEIEAHRNECGELHPFWMYLFRNIHCRSAGRKI